MTDRPGPESFPDPRSPAEAFAVLGHEIRVGVLRVLWESHDPIDPEADIVPVAPAPVPYSELLRRLGLRDHGKLNYHLSKLVDRFVRRTDEGYVLTGAGRKLVQAIVAGSLVEDPELPPVRTTSPCPLCDAPVVLRYTSGTAMVSCSACPGFGVPGPEDVWRGTLWNAGLPPSALVDRTPDEILGTMHRLALSDLQTGLAGTCPHCTGRTETDLTACDDHRVAESGFCETCGLRNPGEVVVQCATCRHFTVAPVGFAVLDHPAVVAFYHDHGVDVRVDPADLTIRATRFPVEVVATDPLELVLTVTAGGDELRLAVDESLTVRPLADDPETY